MCAAMRRYIRVSGRKFTLAKCREMPISDIGSFRKLAARKGFEPNRALE
jgi:hypothetical protein